MALSHHERRTLEGIERGLRSDDPGMAGRMNPGTGPAHGHPKAKAWFGLLLGIQVTLVGFATAAGAISFGMIVGMYGLLLLACSAGSLLRDGWRRRSGLVRPHRPN
jgi:hypothetical protein